MVCRNTYSLIYMSKSAVWLQSLQVGDIIQAVWRGEPEDLLVIRGCHTKRNKPSVLIKRKHLKQNLPMTERGDYVSYQFSCKVGNEYFDFTRWNVVRKIDDVANPAGL